MSTRIVTESKWERDEQTYAVVRQYVIVAEPVPFDIAEAHVELGGELIAMQGTSVYQVFDHSIGPTFEGLWKGCTFHLLVRRL